MHFFFKYTILISLFIFISNCKSQQPSAPEATSNVNSEVSANNDVNVEEDIIVDPTVVVDENFRVGAARMDKYLPLLKNKRVGVVTNQTGIVMMTDTGMSYDSIDVAVHIVDLLLLNGVKVTKIFAPEHGFRGSADAGETVKNGTDLKTGLPIISLYGSNKKPSSSQIADLDVIIYDIQDVGARFYTYISTLSYVMEAAAENHKEVMIFDRPNPNGSYIDGPVLQKAFQSFVGLHPIPIVYAMTPGEYGQMLNGEKWLKNGVQCDLKVISCDNYWHDMPYSLPVKPSPNLPNDLSINLYPSTCFFEGTNVSEGRGTDKQFQVFGSPYLKNYTFSFTPHPNEGAKNPRYNGVKCYGEDLSHHNMIHEINLEWLIKAYQNNTQQPFWIKNSGEFWIDKLAGTDQLRKQIDQGWNESQIKQSWQNDLEHFKQIRKKYLLYP